MKKAIIITIIIVTIIFLSFLFLKRVSTPIYVVEDVENLVSSANIYGIIEGSLGYPSEYIPEMVVCAENTKTKEEFCTYEKLENNKYKYNIGYQLETPPGDYYVYSRLINDKQKTIDDYKAYYSEFVICGMTVNCSSHKNIAVNVKAEEITSDVDPIDWYE